MVVMNSVVLSSSAREAAIGQQHLLLNDGCGCSGRGRGRLRDLVNLGSPPAHGRRGSRRIGDCRGRRVGHRHRRGRNAALR